MLSRDKDRVANFSGGPSYHVRMKDLTCSVLVLANKLAQELTRDRLRRNDNVT